MDKELIIKYKDEFAHWLKEGKVLAYYKKDDEPKWLTDEECTEYEGHDNFNHILQNSLRLDDVLIVIDDELVEFRKALAEGKTVQYNFGNYGINRKDFPNTWKDLDLSIGILADRASPENYRIKPEPHKFKVGDWVIHNGKYKRVTKAVDGYIDSLDNAVAVIMKEESLELWKPKINEYFWYKNDLVKFEKTQTNAGILLQSIRGCSYYPSEENFEDYYEPFIGQLPTYIKDSDES